MIEVESVILAALPLIFGWMLDQAFGDPERLLHPVVLFGKSISFCEHRLNRGIHRVLKGGFTAVGLILTVYFLTWLLLRQLSHCFWVAVVAQTVLVFFCLAGKTLRREVRMVFEAADRSLDAGRRQVGRIVGRDTANLSDQEVRTAALETLAENLSDGVVAPVFWYMLLGVPGMLAYKMVNTLDSMIGYKNARFRDFGRVAAKIDDAANYIPARLTAVLMILASWKWNVLTFVKRYGGHHASPNSGYPEAALAGILDCRFGGPHDYFGETVYKPFIGIHPRPVTSADMRTAIAINSRVEYILLPLAALFRALLEAIS